MEYGYDIKRAEKLIDEIETETGCTCFGRTEKDLLCNYAYHIADMDKIEQLADIMAMENHELLHGFPDPELEREVQAEIDRVDADWAAKGYLKNAEERTEQNMNQIDGLINNEPPRVNQGYTIIDSELVGNNEIVLGYCPKAPQPFVTWERDVKNDGQSGREDFYWGKYFVSEEYARRNFRERVDEKEKSRPSIRFQLKTDTNKGRPGPAAPKKDGPER